MDKKGFIALVLLFLFLLSRCGQKDTNVGNTDETADIPKQAERRMEMADNEIITDGTFCYADNETEGNLYFLEQGGGGYEKERTKKADYFNRYFVCYYGYCIYGGLWLKKQADGTGYEGLDADSIS